MMQMKDKKEERIKFKFNDLEILSIWFTFNVNLIKNKATIQLIIPNAVINTGNKMYFYKFWMLAKMTKEAHEASLNEPNKSEPIPAISPTLSPTLSAMVAGLSGLSSSNPYSILPTKSAPTSAALVYIPPPILPNIAALLAPNPKAAIFVYKEVYPFLSGS